MVQIYPVHTLKVNTNSSTDLLDHYLLEEDILLNNSLSTNSTTSLPCSPSSQCFCLSCNETPVILIETSNEPLCNTIDITANKIEKLLKNKILSPNFDADSLSSDITSLDKPSAVITTASVSTLDGGIYSSYPPPSPSFDMNSDAISVNSTSLTSDATNTVASNSSSSLSLPSFLIYSQLIPETNHHQIGILCSLEVSDCEKKIIKKHENCIPKGISSEISLLNNQSSTSFSINSSTLSLNSPFLPFPSSTPNMTPTSSTASSLQHYQSHYVDPIMIMYRQNTKIDSIIQRIIQKEPCLVIDEEKKREKFDLFNSNLNFSSNSSFSETTTSSTISISNLIPEFNSFISLESESKPPNTIHSLWKVTSLSDILEIQAAFQSVDSLYIADGHHRTSDACEIYQDSNKKLIKSCKYLTALLYPDTHLKILSFNRCLKSFGPSKEEDFFELLNLNFDVYLLSNENGGNDSSTSISTSTSLSSSINFELATSSAIADVVTSSVDSSDSSIPFNSFDSISTPLTCYTTDSSDSSSSISDDSLIYSHSLTTSENNLQMFYNNCWYQLIPKHHIFNNNNNGNNINTNSFYIDALILNEHLIFPLLKKKFPESEQYMIYLDDRKGKKAVENLIHTKQAVVGFRIGSISTKSVMKVSDSDILLPPKVTFFDPKPLSGMLIRLKK